MDSEFYGQDFVTESFRCSRASLNDALADTKLSSVVIFNFFAASESTKGGQASATSKFPPCFNMDDAYWRLFSFSFACSLSVTFSMAKLRRQSPSSRKLMLLRRSLRVKP